MLCVFLFSWSILLVFGQIEFNHKTFLDNQENVEILWRVEGDMISFEVRAYTTGYVGIGFSKNGGMKGSDIMIAWVTDGTPMISDRHGIGNEEPEVDEHNDLELLYGSETDGLTIIGYRRKLITCDSDDYDLSSDTVKMIWAYHPDDPDAIMASYHGPQRRGVRSVILIDVLSSTLGVLPNDVQSFDILTDNYVVPNDTITTYWSTHVELPKLSSPHHVIRINPIIQPGNEGIVHHLVLKECYGLMSINGSRSLNYRSEAMYQFRSCSKMIYAWAVGGGSLDFPEDVGYVIAGMDPIKYLQLTVHYDNAHLSTGISDSSGVRIHYTPKLRKYDSSLLMIGVPSLSLFVLPPSEEAFTIYGSCNRKCLKEILSEGEMKIFSVLLHAHLAGVSMRVTHYRNGEYIGEISKDSAYDFDLQEFRYLKQHWIVKPEDDLMVECIYNTMDREETTFGGLATTDEMCLAFLFYYPKSNAGKCYSVPQPDQLEKKLNIDLKNTTLREAIRTMEWTHERRKAVRQWWYESSRMTQCTNYTGQPAYPISESIPGLRGFVETESLADIIDIQSQIIENDKCSLSTNLKGTWFTIVMLECFLMFL